MLIRRYDSAGPTRASLTQFYLTVIIQFCFFVLDYIEDICPYATFQLSKTSYSESTYSGNVYSGPYHSVRGSFVYHEPKAPPSSAVAAAAAAAAADAYKCRYVSSPHHALFGGLPPPGAPTQKLTNNHTHTQFLLTKVPPFFYFNLANKLSSLTMAIFE